MAFWGVLSTASIIHKDSEVSTQSRRFGGQSWVVSERHFLFEQHDRLTKKKEQSLND